VQKASAQVARWALAETGGDCHEYTPQRHAAQARGGGCDDAASPHCGETHRAQPRLAKRLDQVRDASRRKHCSPGIERTYVGRIKGNMNQAYFLPHGLRKVQAGMNLLMPTCKFRRAISILGVPQMIEALA